MPDACIYWLMMALTDVVPLSPPMIKVAYTVFVVPVKLAPVAFAWNAYRSVPVGFISVSRFTPSMTPLKAKDPSFCATKEPIGMVVAKLPTWIVTGCVTGLIAGGGLLKVILDRK